MSNKPAEKQEWKNLSAHAQEIKNQPLNGLFKSDDGRFNKFSLECTGLFFDYSKQHITNETIEKLCALAKACEVEQKRDDMFSGHQINTTEQRSVLHTALRRPKSDSVEVHSQNIMPDVHQTLEKMESFSNDIRNGAYLGATGKAITQIVSIGVGGSDLGSRMVCEALKEKGDHIESYFVANIDGDEIESVLDSCDAEKTLFVIISKSFGTQETLTNAKAAEKWLKEKLSKDDNVSQHFIAISANTQAAIEFGIKENNIFPLWEWVNGRFSLWSAVGLPICLQLGFDRFKEFLSGAYIMDQHFQTADLDKNIPVLMALIGIWNRNFLNHAHLALLPYAQKLSYLPTYLRQLEMESNGKTVDINGDLIKDYKTNPIVFGEVGTNGQHSFYQLLHQGSDTVPCDFIGVIKSNHTLKHHHRLLLNNMMAQGQALMQGNQENTEPHRYFEGNKPSSTLLIEQLDAKHLGMLIALYEHKCFVQGVIWNINSFDQFGVELGKELSHKLEKNDLTNADSSTSGLFLRIHKSSK